MDQPELTSHLPLPSLRARPRAETRARSGGQWVSRYRPGVPVPRVNMRETIVQAELRMREKEFCDKKTVRFVWCSVVSMVIVRPHPLFRVFCGTWNVNGKPPPSSLDQFLREFEGHGDNGASVTPDIYAVG